MKRILILISLFLFSCWQDVKKSDFIIAIDIGHTLNNPGAISGRGRGEFLYNQNIARMLRAELHNLGFSGAFIINEEGEDIGLGDRTAVAAKKGARLFISLHHDSVQPQYLNEWVFNGDTFNYCDNFQGYSLFVSQSSPMAKQNAALAGSIGEHFLNYGFKPSHHHAEDIIGENRKLLDANKGIYRYDELAVLKTALMPAVLVECGVLVHREEDLLLGNPVYQRALVTNLAQAIKAWGRYSLMQD